jgi:S-adenosylmethionine/arginine decarboxylase-like enzyme
VKLKALIKGKKDMDERYWGYHAIVDAAGCDHELITSYDNVYNFAKQLVKDIDMVAYGEPQIVNFGSGDKAGFTLVQLIETSNICAHFVNELNEMYLDVFSCKSFDPAVVEQLVIKYFGAKSVNKVSLTRCAPRE